MSVWMNCMFAMHFKTAGSMLIKFGYDYPREAKVGQIVAKSILFVNPFVLLVHIFLSFYSHHFENLIEIKFVKLVSIRRVR